MNKPEVCKNAGILVGKLSTLQEYKDKYSNAPRGEQHFEGLMKSIQDNCSDVMFMGGQTVRSFTMGHRSFRRPSEDLDAIIQSVDGIEELNKYISDNGGFLSYIDEFGCVIGELKGTPLSFFIGDLYGIPIEQIRTHTYTDIGMLTPEMLTTLKLRRKRKDKWRGKDLLDIGSLLLSGNNGKIEFDIDTQASIARQINSTMLPDAMTRLLEQDGFRGSERKILNKIKPNSN